MGDTACFQSAGICRGRVFEKNNFSGLKKKFEVDPRDLENSFSFGEACTARGEYNRALAVVEETLAFGSESWKLLRLKASLLQHFREFEESEKYYHLCIGAGSPIAPIRCDIGRMHMSYNDHSAAHLQLLHAISDAPANQFYYDVLAVSLLKLYGLDELKQKLDRILPPMASKPMMFGALAMQLIARGLHEEGLAFIAVLSHIDPKNRLIYTESALIDIRLRKYKNAAEKYKRLDREDLHDERSTVMHLYFLLSMERFEEARELFQRRWQRPRLCSDRNLAPEVPLWDGVARCGKSILLVEPNGYGDNLMFIRFARWFSERGMRVIAESSHRLKSVCRYAAGVSEVVLCFDDYEVPDYRIEYYCLPLLLEGALPISDSYVPYLQMKKSDSLSDLELDRELVLVGLSWEGSRQEPENPYTWRCVQPQALEPLFHIPGACIINLQAGETSMSFVAPPATFNSVSHLTSFEKIVKVLPELDLLVTIDSSLAHLAGAMGVKTILMLPHTSEWRWFTGRQDSPWYPSLRLIRQTRPGRWCDVVAQTVNEINKIVSDKRTSGSTMIIHDL